MSVLSGICDWIARGLTSPPSREPLKKLPAVDYDVLYCDECWEYRTHKLYYDPEMDVTISYCPCCDTVEAHR